jgi:hypothetical protein
MLPSLLGLTACGLIPKPDVDPLGLEIPIRQELIDPCARYQLPAESELPPLAEGEAGEAQLVERRFWAGEIVEASAVTRLACRQRDEIVSVVQAHNVLIRED